ncbi:hypothetical protein [Pseudomonas bharatica]|uniref:hypothetical protein n=1 Tax=Pseudomonas bharatica TaxID=2692112 RepID=UPI003B27E729
MTFLSRSEYAKSKGWSRQYVGKLVSQARLVITEAGLVDVDASEQYLAMTADPAKRSPKTSGAQREAQPAPPETAPPSMLPVVPGYQHARARLAQAQAALAETTVREKNGELVSVEVVDAAAFAAGRMLRDQILSLPAQLAPELSALSDPWQIEKHLAGALRRVLDDVASMTASDFQNAIYSSN